MFPSSTGSQQILDWENNAQVPYFAHLISNFPAADWIQNTSIPEPLSRMDPTIVPYSAIAIPFGSVFVGFAFISAAVATLFSFRRSFYVIAPGPTSYYVAVTTLLSGSSQLLVPLGLKDSQPVGGFRLAVSHSNIQNAS